MMQGLDADSLGPSPTELMRPWRLVLPAVLVVGFLFGGGAAFGVFQALGYLPSAGMTRLSLSHVGNALCDPDFIGSLCFSLYVSIFSTAVAAFFATLLAVALDALSGQSRVAAFLIQVPLAVPHLVVAVAMFFLLSPTGWLSRLGASFGIIGSAERFPILVNDDGAIGIMAVYVWKEVPFIGLMVLAAIKQGGADFIEAGKTLKAGSVQRFRHILLPMIGPSLWSASLIVFAYTFGNFEVPYLLGRTHPTMLPVQAYKNYADIDLAARPEGIALGIIIAAVTVLCIWMSRRFMAKAEEQGTAP